MLSRAVTLCALASSLLFQVQAKETITVTGSTSVSHIVEVLGEHYTQSHPDQQVSVQGIGSSAGISAVKQDAAKIGISSRYLKPAEINPNVNTITIAHDGIALVVNKDNPVTNLTKDQVTKIYRGEIKNWSQVGGQDLPMAVVSRENSSGSRFSFEEHMGLIKTVNGELVSAIDPQVLYVSTNGTVKTLVSHNKHAIGYVSLGSVDESIKPISFNGVEPSITNIENGSYKIARPFLMLHKVKGMDQSAVEFVKFVTSAQGQKIIADNGYLTAQ